MTVCGRCAICCVWYVCVCLVRLHVFGTSACAWYVCVCLVCLHVFGSSACVWYVATRTVRLCEVRSTAAIQSYILSIQLYVQTKQVIINEITVF